MMRHHMEYEQINQKAKLLPQDIFYQRYQLNRQYVVGLETKHLLHNYYVEAGLHNMNHFPDDLHKGWESPACQLRGHFTGHWLSACARIYHETLDHEVLGKALYVIDELAYCQQTNGGEWAACIPEKYFWKMLQGQDVWAPHYTVHKLFMGLIDMKKFADCDKALQIADHFADWFVRYTDTLDKAQLKKVLSYETGGMLEAWADLYALTQNEKYLVLIKRYDRETLFTPLLKGEDALTNQHTNTTIPEIHGCARIYEVTGEVKYREIVESYWNQAVTERGYFATGGQSSGEIWTPKHNLADRLSPTNQEHCTVYNMIRLADYLYRWSGDVNYLQYIERNLYNGILAQQNPQTGMVIYYLPLHAGSQKKWAHPTKSFWCCQGTLVQAHTLYTDLTYYVKNEVLTVAQFIPSTTQFTVGGQEINVQLTRNFSHKTKNEVTIHFDVSGEKSIQARVRIPYWSTETKASWENGEVASFVEQDGFAIFELTKSNTLLLQFGKKITIDELPGEKGTVAFSCGPETLAALCEEEQVITLPENEDYASIFRMFDEYGRDANEFSLIANPKGLRFVPIHTIVDDIYTVYFPTKK